MIGYFEGRTTIDLVPGRVYDVLESCGMMSFRAEYIGLAQKGHGDRLLIFKMPNDENYRYCGGFIRTDLPRRTEDSICVYIQVSHYGQSIATLRKSGSHEDDRWVIRE